MTEQSNEHHTIEKRLNQIDLNELCRSRTFHPSPVSWGDEVLYFLFLDRFSDAKEYGGFTDREGRPVKSDENERSTPLFNLEADAARASRSEWFESGKGWCGGTLAGLRDKLGYLKKLGITALWISPVFKQVTGSNDYHGYGIQNFLDVDPHFGTRQELRELVQAAHAEGIRVILDIIVNHAGDVFAYSGNEQRHYNNGVEFPVQGFRRFSGEEGSIPFRIVSPEEEQELWPDAAVWPAELQEPGNWRKKGEIGNWDGFPDYVEGDFLSLKDLRLGNGISDPSAGQDIGRRISGFSPSETLAHLIKVYRFWIAYADIDGYRLDTVKHMEPGAVRLFVNAIHEFAQSIGKENFTIIGEITGGRALAFETLETTGLDAALGINDVSDKLEFLAKGWRSPGHPETPEQEGYFDIFRNSLQDCKSSHQWYGNHIVTMFDDHDQVGVRHKFRFCGQGEQSYTLLPAALGLNLATMGIPCLYYGTEQAFNGADHRDNDDSYSDVFLRECMFGGAFGSMQSTGRHFFNESHEIYRFISRLAALRSQHIALRRGRQYLRQVSASGHDNDFHYPQPLGGELRWLIAWSRIFADREYLCACNTDPRHPLTLWATVDSSLHHSGETMNCLFSSDREQEGTSSDIEARNGKAIAITVPPGGFVVYH